MTAHNSVPIQLHDQPTVFTIENEQTLITVVEQLNIVTERLNKLEEQIANGTLIINPTPTEHVHLTAVDDSNVGSQSGWQPARR